MYIRIHLDKEMEEEFKSHGIKIKEAKRDMARGLCPNCGRHGTFNPDCGGSTLIRCASCRLIIDSKKEIYSAYANDQSIVHIDLEIN